MLTPDDLEALLESALARVGEPVDVNGARKALPAGKKPKREQVQAVLEKLVDDGRLHRWPGRATKFSAVSPQSFTREQVLQVLAAGPLPEAEIKKKLPASARSLVKAALAALVKERIVLKHPKLARRDPYGLHPPSAVAYLAPEVALMFKRLMKLGFKEADLQLALRRYTGAAVHDDVSADRSAEILAAMSGLNSQASRGALVYVAELRAALTNQFRDKESFDRAVLELAKEGKVQLQANPWPGRLSEGEKNALIPNGQGGFFDAIGIRLE